MKPLSCALAIVAATSALHAADYHIHSWETKELTSEFWSEGAAFGDINKDGVNDIVSGPYWYQGPSFEKRHEFYPATQSHKRKTDSGEETVRGFDPHAYSRNFIAYTHDFNSDGWTDVLVLGFPGEESSWFENPKGKEGHWKKYDILKVTDNESPTFTDLTGDGKPEIVCSSEGYYGFAEPDWTDPTKPFKFRRISPKGPWQRFTHGIGVGDVNGDGKQDILEKDGWWEQPASLQGDPEWKKHNFNFSQHGSSQMFAYDVDGDGDNDVITALAAHGYGLAWYEHIKENGQVTFKQHIIINDKPEASKYGVKFSQLHAVDLFDIDNDGLKDIITGKRWWAHGPQGDAEPNAPAVLYWFKLTRTGGSAEFVPHQVHDNSGVGTQVMAGKINGDQWADIVVGNKKGTFVHLHKVKPATREEHERAQPKPLLH